MSVDLEEILYKERMFKKELRREEYGEVVKTIRDRYIGEITNLTIRVVESGRLFWHLPYRRPCFASLFYITNWP